MRYHVTMAMFPGNRNRGYVSIGIQHRKEAPHVAALPQGDVRERPARQTVVGVQQQVRESEPEVSFAVRPKDGWPLESTTWFHGSTVHERRNVSGVCLIHDDEDK